MGLESIQASIQDVMALLADMSDSDATPDSLGPDIAQALELLSKALEDTEETSDAITGKAEGLDRLIPLMRYLREEVLGLS